MKPREYCCCAIPIINAGIYFTLIEQFVLGILVGILSMSTPSIVGAVTPSFAPWLFGIVCFVAGGVQVLGFIGVAREKAILFRRYLSLHALAIVAAFSVALAWIIISASRHSTAKANCLADFFNGADSEQKTEGDTLCDIFPLVDVGVMGSLWVILAALHLYLYVVLSSYSSAQQRDHAKYDTFNESTTLQNESIALNNRNEPYDPPYQQRDIGGYSHLRKESAASLSDVLAEPVQQPSDGYSVYRQGSYPPPSQRQPSLPANAYTLDESPTPRVGQSYDSGNRTADIDRPMTSQAHPAEGSFGRKAPRLMKKDRPYDY
ncbi:hypothetical protein DFH07DRAFT_789505 [Mycena maculata]|uniref:Transmembrane protein n=1 Tax=Mycena maculata TaxID=230809 RepID=A0AAD7P1N7_9AGAR|nr:hypothetical protein DFH07DRAFT_789505 [Mycena maculata]